MAIQPVAYPLCRLNQELATRDISTTPYKITDFLAGGDLKGKELEKLWTHTLTYLLTYLLTHSMEPSPS